MIISAMGASPVMRINQPLTQRPPLNSERWSAGNATRLSAVTVAVTAAVPAGRAVFTRTGFIDRQWAPLKVFFVERGNRFGRIVLRSHFDECKAARATGSAILHDINCEHRTDLPKIILQIVLGCCEG